MDKATIIFSKHLFMKATSNKGSSPEQIHSELPQCQTDQDSWQLAPFPFFLQYKSPPEAEQKHHSGNAVGLKKIYIKQSIIFFKIPVTDK